MITQALSLRAALGTIPGEGRDPQTTLRLTVTTTTPRHVREDLLGPVVRTEWISEDRVYELPATALDMAISELQRVRTEQEAAQTNGRH